MAPPVALLIGGITHVKDEWEALSPQILLKVCDWFGSWFVVTHSLLGIRSGDKRGLSIQVQGR